MGDRYYEQAIQFAMRDFVSKLVAKYLEYLEEINPGKVEEARELFKGFEVWLFRTTASYASRPIPHALDSLKDGGKKPEFVIFDDIHDAGK